MNDYWIYERAARERGYRQICGVDEAGRGPLAGPVYAAAVILPFGCEIEGLDDSKKVSEKNREILYGVVTQTAAAWSVASATVQEIETHNILGATMLAMRRAIAGLSVCPDVALVDGTVARDFPVDAQCIPGGDGKSASIAAASILAKVTRDRYMLLLDEAFPDYGFARHKGYGTRAHTEALLRHGPCAEHRSLFISGLCKSAGNRSE